MDTSKQGKENLRIKCSGCGNQVHQDRLDWLPFCSLRCKQIDLGRWFNEDYGLPVDPELEEEF